MNNQVDNESLRNLQYFSQLAHSETERIRELIQPFIDNDEPASPGTLEQIIRVLGEFGARVSVIEQAAEQQLLAENPLESGPLLVGEWALSCEDLADGDFHEPEPDGEGRTIRWTRFPELNLRLPLYRNTGKTLRIYFSAIIKPGYARELNILVDGNLLSHDVCATPGGLCLECRLPPGKDLAMTAVTLRLPAVHSPLDLGVSDDYRELGIAISHISVSDGQASLRSRLASLISPFLQKRGRRN